MGTLWFLLERGLDEFCDVSMAFQRDRRTDTGAEVKRSDNSPDKLDCSELVQWAVERAIGKGWVDGSANQYAACHHISVEQAIRTKGALLFIKDDGKVHHVAPTSKRCGTRNKSWRHSTTRTHTMNR